MGWIWDSGRHTVANLLGIGLRRAYPSQPLFSPERSCCYILSGRADLPVYKHLAMWTLAPVADLVRVCSRVGLGFGLGG